MDFNWTPQQQAVWDDISQFASAELVADMAERQREGTFLETHWQKIAAKGIFGLRMPKEYGGQGCDQVTTIRALEALGYGCPDNGFTLAVGGQTWSVQTPILKFGTDDQKQRFLPGLINGSLKGAHAMTEPESGSDAFSLTTSARKVGGGYVLNGKKIFIGMGPAADVLTLFATTNPAVGRWGITAFIVETATPGITRRTRRDKMGLLTEPMGEIVLEDVIVPAANRLGREGAGASIFSAGMDYEHGFIFSSHVGAMARQLDRTIDFVKTRQQGGQPISKYQAVSHRIAEMNVRLETARAFLYKTAWMVDQGMDFTLQAAMTKLVISELFVESSLDAIRAHGGRGYLGEFGVERDLRDAVGGVLYAGTSDIQRNLIAGLLGL
jgi:hypothetical protein